MRLFNQKDSITIYAVVHTAVDADKCYFPEPEITGTYLSFIAAQEAWEQQIEKERERLDDRYDCEEYESFQWEMYQNGYAGACFSRFEIIETKLHLSEGKEG